MSLSEERLDEIRAKLREQDFDWDHPFDVDADDLLTEVDRLTRERDDLSNRLADAKSWEPEAERLRARYKALRADVERLHMSHTRPSETQGTHRILARDTKRGEQA